MGQRGPIGAWNIAALDRIVPQSAYLALGVHACELIDREPVPFVERLVQQLRRPVVPAGKAHCGTMQLMVRAVGRHEAKLLQSMAQLVRGQAGSYDRAVQVGVEFPDPGATRRFRAPHQGRRNTADNNRLRCQGRECACAHACRQRFTSRPG